MARLYHRVLVGMASQRPWRWEAIGGPAFEAVNVLRCFAAYLTSSREEERTRGGEALARIGDRVHRSVDRRECVIEVLALTAAVSRCRPAWPCNILFFVDPSDLGNSVR